MSEKRFKQVGLWIIDDPNSNVNSIADLIDTKLMSTNEVVDLLNELFDENEQLKKENEQLKKEYKIAIDEMVTDYKKLEKENEQLRKQLDFYLLDEFEWKEKYGD